MPNPTVTPHLAWTYHALFEVAGFGVLGRIRHFLCPGPKLGRRCRKVAKAGNRVKVTLGCAECKQRNYNSFKNKKNDPERLEMNKYCPFCRKHTVHNETK